MSGVRRQVGTAFGIALLGAIPTNRYNTELHDFPEVQVGMSAAFISGEVLVFYTAAPLLAVGMLAALILVK